MRISDWSSDVCSSDLFPRKDDKTRGVVAFVLDAFLKHLQSVKLRRPGGCDRAAAGVALIAHLGCGGGRIGISDRLYARFAEIFATLATRMRVHQTLTHHL